MSVQFAVYV